MHSDLEKLSLKNIIENMSTSKVYNIRTLNGLFMVQTVWPGVPVSAVVGATLKHLNSVPQYLENVLNVSVIIITDAHLSLVSIAAVTVPLTGESH